MAAEKTYDLIVIGSGPGGYVAAVRGAQLGLRVACVEKGTRLGGVCLNVGCIPSKALLDSSEYFHLANAHFAEHGIQTGGVTLDLPAMMARKDKVVEALTDQVRQLLTGNSVDIVHAAARLIAPGEVALKPLKASGDSSPGVLKGRSILLATGSEPVPLPGMDFDGESIVSSTEALDLGAVPEHLGIVGGGYIGLEMGSVWNRLGARVSVIEMLPKIAATLDGQVARTLDRLLRHQGLDIRTATRVVEARKSGGKVEVTVEKDGKSETLSFDKLLVSVGRRPLTRGLGLAAAGVETDAGTGQVIVDGSYRTSAPGVYAVGDLIAGPMLAHKASAEGTAAVEIIAGRTAEVNYDAIPAVVYTWPEVAGVGLTEEEAKSRGIPYCTGSFPFSGTGRARCMGEKDGFVKLISHSRTDRVLGAHIIGPRASDMIAECVLAMEFGASAEDIARTVHGHPTFAEALQEAAMTATKCSIYTR